MNFPLDFFLWGPHWGLCAMSTSGPRHEPWKCPRVDVGEIHVRGHLKFVSQMSIFGDVHAWTILQSTRGHPLSSRADPGPHTQCLV
jgi:hypothetical protein